MFDSIKKLRLSPEQEQAYRAWLTAQEEYRAECALFQRINKQIPKNPYERDAMQIVIQVKAKERYRAACKKYYQAQQQYNSSKSSLRTPAGPNDMDAIKDAIEQFVQSLTKIQPSLIQVGAQAQEDAALEARFGSIEQSSALSAIALAARERKLAREAPELERMLETTDELEDFDTPPEALVPAAEQLSGERPLGHPQENQEDHSSERNSKERQALSAQELIRKYGIPEKQ